MPRQTSPKTTLIGASSVNLGILDPNNYYNATLSGSSAVGTAHTTSISPLLTILSGDTLVATGNNTTLYGGAGKDSLVALGNNDYLIAGTRADTLVGTTLAGGADTLAGNGLSSLVGRGANDTFVLNSNGDKITSSVSGGKTLMQGTSGTVLTGINNFSLADQTTRGTGIQYISKLVYTGPSGATLYGNNLNDTIIGNTLSGGNFIQAALGPGRNSLVGGSGNDTLAGNGRSTLNGNGGVDAFYVTAANGGTPGDTIQQSGANGLVVVRGNGTYDLGRLGNQSQGISTLRSDGSGSLITLVGNNNAQGNLIIGTNVNGGSNSLVAGNNAYNATLVAASTGGNTLVGNAGINSIVAGAGNDLISLASASVLARDTINAGLGNDTLALGAGSATDAAFLNVRGTEVLSLASSSYVTLGGYAQTLAGISTVVSGSGPDRIDASAYSTALVIDSGANIFNADTLKGAGTAATTFILGSSAALATSTVIGGNDKGDLLVVRSGNIADAAFAGVSATEILSLGNAAGSSSSVTLGSAAKAAGISSLLGGVGDMGAYQNVSGKYLIQGGAGQNSFTLGSASYLTDDTISGGSGSSTLQVAAAANLGANSFKNVSNVGTLRLAGSSAVSLDGAAQQAGIRTVVGGVGNDTITQLTSNSAAMYLDGGLGNDIFALDAIGASTVAGGLGNDSLILGSPAVLNGGSFANVSSVEYLALSSPSAITLNAGVSSKGIASVVGGIGNDTFTDDGSSVSSFYINGGGATSGNLFTVANSSRIGVGKDTIVGGGGIDTLAVSTAGNIDDLSFRTVSSVESLSLTGGSSVVLSSYAKASGLSTVTGGTGLSDTFDASSFNGGITLDGSKGSGDLFILNASQFAAGTNRVIGGLGADTLSLATAATSVSDASFANAVSVEVLQLSSPTAMTLGSAAAKSGITTVITGSGSDTVDASRYTPTMAGPFTIDATANLSSGDLLVGSNAVGNKFLFASVAALSNSTLTGGNAAAGDTLAVTAPANLSDAAFRRVSGIEVLSLGNAAGSSSSVTLGSAAKAAGISSLLGGVGDMGAYQNVSGKFLIQGGGGNTSVTLASASYLTDDTISGGTGSTTLQVASAANLGANSFRNVSNVGTLRLTGSSAVSLDGAAQNAGIQTVIGGTGSDTFTQLATNSYALTLAASAGSNLFNLDNADQLALDSIAGGVDGDTLAIGNGALLDDSLFGNVSGVEVVALSGSSAVTIGGAAQSAGIQTVIGGTGNTTLVQDANNTDALLLDGSRSSSVLIGLTANQLESNTDTIVGGTGMDTLALSTVDTLITDDAFKGVSSMEILSLTSDLTDGPSAVTLGSFAKAAGLKGVVGGTGNDTFTRDTLFSGNLTLDGSKGAGDVFNVDISQIGSTTVIGGSTDLDTLVLASSGSLALESSSNIIDVPTVQLTGESYLTLGSGVSGISTIVTANAAGAVDASALQYGVTIDASALDNPETSTIPGGQNLKGSSSQANAFLLSGTTALRNSTLTGGTGNDTLTFTPAGVTLQDDDFQNLASSSIEVLRVTSNSSVTLGSFATGAGISTLLGGDGNDIFDVSEAGSLYVDGSRGQGNNYVISSSKLQATGGDTIVGGSAGIDTLALVTPDTNLEDGRFGALSNIGTLVLPDASAVTLGSVFQSAGITTVIGADGGDTFTQSLDYTRAAYLKAGNGDDLFVINSAAQLSLDSILGGDGSDTLHLSQGGSIGDAAFAGVSGVEVLSLAAGTDVTLGAAASTNLSTIVGGSGRNAFTQTEDNRQALFIDGSASDSNVFNLTSVQLALGDESGNLDTLVGKGSDRLNVINPSNRKGSDVTDAAFTNISGVSVLGLSSPVAVTLGSQAQYTGIHTVIGGSGSDSITIDTSYTDGITLDGGAGAGDLFSFTSSTQLTGTSSSVIGGSGSDTLAITSADSDITDDLFAKLSSVEVLSIAASSAATLDGNASAAGIKRVVTGAGGYDTVTATTFTGQIVIDASFDEFFGYNSLVGANSGTSFLVANGFVLPTDTVKGGAGSDTLTITNQDVLSAASFANVTGIEAISLTGSSAITMDSTFGDAAIATIYGGTGNSTFTDTDGYATPLRIDASNGSGSSFVVKSSKLGSGNDTLIGSSFRPDTLTIVSGNTDDAAFGTVSYVDNLVISGFGSSVALGGNAGKTGIKTVLLAGGSNTLVQGSDNTTALLIDGTGGSGNTYRIASSVKLGAGLDTIRGSGSTDTLAIATAENVSDKSFAQLSGVGTVSLTGTSTVNLGSNAVASGISTVSGGSAATTFIQTQGLGSGVSLVGAGGNDTFRLSDASFLGTDSLYADGGTDVLHITSATSAITDASFANVLGVDVLSLTGASKAVLGSNANTDGLATVYGGLGNSTLTQQATFTNGLTLVGGAGNYNDLFTLDKRSYLSGGKDSIIGNGGIDTLALTEATTYADTDFSKVSGIKALSLTGASTVTLDLNARKAGFATVFGGAGNTSIIQTANETNTLTLVGGNSADSFTIANATQLANNSIAGGLGTDTLAITSAASINDGFGKVRDVELLNASLSGLANTITLGSSGQAAGIRTVLGGSGNDTFNASAYTTGVTLNGGGGVNVLTGGSGNDLLISQALTGTLSGGTSGTDTLQIGGLVSANNTFTNLTRIEVLDVSGSGLNNSIILGTTGQAAGIRTLLGGSGNDTFSAAAYDNTTQVLLNGGDGNNSLTGGAGANTLLSGTGSDTLNGGGGNDTLQAWSTTSNTASDTLTGGTGEDLFILGSASGNAYGTSGSKALITDFVGGTDYLQLKDWGSGASDYRVDATVGAGFTHQLYDMHTGSDVLIANINYTGTNASNDLLGSKALFA